MKKATVRYHYIAIAIIAAAFIAAALSFFIPVAPTVVDAGKAHLRTAAAVVLAGLFVGAAIWLWNILSHFRTRLRVAYMLLSLGLVLFSIAMLQLPIFGLFDLWKTAWATGGGAILIFILSAIPMYLGMRQLARLAGVKSIAASFWFVTAVTVAIAVAGAIISPSFIRHDMVGAPIYIGAVWAGSSYIFFAGLMAYKSKQALGPSYSRALQAQATAFFVLAASAFNEGLVVTFMPRTTTFYSVYGVYLWTFAIGGFLFVRACYQFQLLTAAYTPSLAGNANAPVSDQDYVDSIVNVADLASRVDDINPILDGMREVTARRASEQSLTKKDKSQLLEVYRQLEVYLTTSDPLRTFTHEQLLDHVTPGFNRLLQQS